MDGPVKFSDRKIGKLIEDFQLTVAAVRNRSGQAVAAAVPSDNGRFRETAGVVSRGRMRQMMIDAEKRHFIYIEPQLIAKAGFFVFFFFPGFKCLIKYPKAFFETAGRR